MLKLQITNNQGKTCEILEIKRCDKLTKKPNPIEYIIDNESRKQIIGHYEKVLRKTKSEEKKNEIQTKIDNIDIPKMISGIDYAYGENPDKYFELEFENGAIKNLAVDGTVKLINIPIQEEEIQIGLKG